ncbi:MAG: choice-of-anchor Q domain-containing protein [Chitinophagaceae bacterium]
MRKLLLFAYAVLHYAIVSATNPVLCFTDLISGPSTGNSDNSHPGQIAGQDGAIVTIWGKRLGSTRGSSQVLVGGQSARIYSWGNAVSPADIYSNLGMQMVAFQIPDSLSNGNVDIAVIVNGVTSNALTFTVRNGNIYYIKTTGNDNTGDGSWTNPWASLDNISYTGALDKISAGDIIYMCDGVSHTSLAGDRAAIDLGNPGTFTSPKAIIGYPGSIASIGNPTIEKSYALWVSGIGPTYNWVLSKLQLTALSDAASMYHNFRLVGNKITAPNGNGPTGAVSALGNHLYIIGNELTNIGFSGTSKLYHPIYMQSAEACSGPRLPTESDREIAWNNLHDNLSYDGINIYRECVSSAYMTNHRVHDNFISNQTGCGIRIGDYVVGENWIYNNVVVNAGLGPDPSGDQAMHVPVYIHAGWDDTTTLIHFYNNTIYGGGFTGGAAWSSSMIGFSNAHPYLLDFRNNIIVSTVAGIDYLNSSLSTPASGVEKNIWYGAGSAPGWDANPLGINPLFINSSTNNFHLLTGSQAIDAAYPASGTTANPLPLFDFDAVSRPQNALTDIGAFEFEITGALPVTWGAISAARENASTARLNWTVSREQSVLEYVVQVSINGISFIDALTVKATNQGSYTSVVSVTSDRRYYFRIVQKDFDGAVSVSKIVTLSSANESNPFKVSPNPAHEYALVNYSMVEGKKITASLYNSNGGLINSWQFQSIPAGTFRIPLQNLPIGIYTLALIDGNLKQVVKLIRK